MDLAAAGPVLSPLKLKNWWTAQLNGRPVRFLIRQAVTYAVDTEWRGEVTRWREDRAR